MTFGCISPIPNCPQCVPIYVVADSFSRFRLSLRTCCGRLDARAQSVPGCPAYLLLSWYPCCAPVCHGRARQVLPSFHRALHTKLACKHGWYDKIELSPVRLDVLAHSPRDFSGASRFLILVGCLCAREHLVMYKHMLRGAPGWWRWGFTPPPLFVGASPDMTINGR
jgi:hypothetical protein